MDSYIERKTNGALLPFDYSGGPPYIHPDSRERYPVKTKSVHQLSTTSSGATSAGTDASSEEGEEGYVDSLASPQSTGSSSEGYEEEDDSASP